MKRGCITTSSFMLSLMVCCLWFPDDTRAENASPPKTQAGTTAGRLAIIDPFTNQPMSGEQAMRNMESAGLTADIEKFNAQMDAVTKANLDSSGLEEQPMAHGAVKVDLKGRFRSPLIGVSTADGRVAVTHRFIPNQDDH